MPILSIITINLNNHFGLEKTIQSVSGQLFHDFEYIIIDGASTDGSLEVIHAHQTTISQWISEPDNGIYHAMNKGIRMAKGDYCLFLNSGDWLAEDNILTQIFAEHPSAAIISGNLAYFDTEKQLINFYIQSPENLTAKTFYNGTLPHQASFIKRELFDKYGLYNEKLKIASDWLFFVKTLLENHESYAHFEGLVAYFNMDGISCRPETHNIPRLEQLTILQQKYPRFIVDYDLLRQLEEKERIWKRSKEFRVYNFLVKTGIISTGVLFLRGINFLKRKLH